MKLTDINGKILKIGDVDTKDRVIKYGDYQGRLGLAFPELYYNIEYAITDYYRMRNNATRQLAKHITNNISSIYLSICNGWYLVDKDGNQYGLNEKNIEQFKIEVLNK